MEPERLSRLNARDPAPDGAFVLYWMEHSQRALHNPALEHAVARAGEHGVPCVVAFVVDPAYPDGNARHFTFMLEGLAETAARIEARGIAFRLLMGRPPDRIVDLAKRARLVVTDRGYLRHLKAWRAEVAEQAPCAVEMVEGDVLVPVDAASRKQEHAARTIRPKINRQRFDYTSLPGERAVRHPARGLRLPDGLDLSDVPRIVEALGADASVAPSRFFRGGTSAARVRLEHFLRSRFDRYAEDRSDPGVRATSELSPYLHLGQISPVEVVAKVRAANAGDEADKETFFEEMIVRRELSINFVNTCADYDSFACVPEWAKATLADHAADPRPATYTLAELEASRTADRYWNAAMTEMRVTGYMHNYMRMYWGKQIITYFRSPEEAFSATLYLNNKYFLDGRDANSFTSVAWLYGIHDRGWPEREIFGKVRSMKASGLERKFDMDAYVRFVDGLEA